MTRWDEDAKYDRPRRHTRPRTKDRPAHEDAVPAVVTTRDRGRYTLLVGEGDRARAVTAMKSRPLGRKGVVTGDLVRVVGDVSGADGSLARIVEVQPRTGVLRRTADDDDPVERVIVANADQLVVVTALADPEPRRRLIDRALVAGEVAHRTYPIADDDRLAAERPRLHRGHRTSLVPVLHQQGVAAPIAGGDQRGHGVGVRRPVLGPGAGVPARPVVLRVLVPAAHVTSRSHAWAKPG